jgi:hypothetical protein
MLMGRLMMAIQLGRFRAVIIFGTALVVVPATLVMFAVKSTTDGATEGNMKECRIRFFYESGRSRTEVQVVITDRDFLKRAVSTPIKNATDDPEPAKYIVVGTMTITDEKAGTDLFDLFVPWGHFKHGDRYKIGDFKEMRDHLKKVIVLAQKDVDR